MMAKLVVLLLLGMYLVFQLGGNDPSQLRPGLANAGVDPTFPKVVEPVETRSLTAGSTKASTLATSSDLTPAKPVVVAAPRPVAPATKVLPAAYSPEPARATPLRQPDKVFTLSALPGQQNAPDPVDVAPQDPVAATGPQVWYVTGRSVNVRLDPSTDAPIVGKLSRGEEALMLADTGAGWAQITVEGDGVSGYVSMDFLSPYAP